MRKPDEGKIILLETLGISFSSQEYLTGLFS